MTPIHAQEMKLVDANKIKPGEPGLKPVNGDLVRIEAHRGSHIAVVNRLYGSDGIFVYYTTQDGVMYHRGDVKVLEIIGKCVFSVYV